MGDSRLLLIAGSSPWGGGGASSTDGISPTVYHRRYTPTVYRRNIANGVSLTFSVRAWLGSLWAVSLSRHIVYFKLQYNVLQCSISCMRLVWHFWPCPTNSLPKAAFVPYNAIFCPSQPRLVLAIFICQTNPLLGASIFFPSIFFPAMFNFLSGQSLASFICPTNRSLKASM